MPFPDQSNRFFALTQTFFLPKISIQGNTQKKKKKKQINKVQSTTE